MSVSALLMLVVEALVSKLGSQYLGALLRAVLDFIPGTTVVAANGDSTDVPANALTAPKELIDYTTALLQKLVANAGLPIYAKLILNQVIKFLPELENSLWNLLFSKGAVANGVPELVQSSGLLPVHDELLEHCKL